MLIQPEGVQISRREDCRVMLAATDFLDAGFRRECSCDVHREKLICLAAVSELPLFVSAKRVDPLHRQDHGMFKSARNLVNFAFYGARYPRGRTLVLFFFIAISQLSMIIGSKP